MKVEELKIYLGDLRLSKMDFSLAYREDKSGIQKEDQLSSYFLIVTLFLGQKGELSIVSKSSTNRCHQLKQF